MIERVINHEMRERFTAGAVRRAVLLQHGDDPAVGPGQLMVRVFVEARDEPGLAAWQQAHQAGMDTFRRELSLRLPAARLLEFTIDSPGGGPGAPRISVPDDGSLAAGQLSGREIVTRALELLRANYVFPDQAEQAATAIEARLEAGEYDDLDEITLTDRVTAHLQELTGDRHLRLRLRLRRADQVRTVNRRNHRTARRCAGSAGLTISASAGSSGWTATSATSTCAGWPGRPTPGRPSPRPWNWWPGRTRSSSTCGTTAAARRRA